MAKRVKQINNLVIKQDTSKELFNMTCGLIKSSALNPNYLKYSVWTPDGRCWEDGLTLEQAEEYCRNTKDFIKK